MVLPPSWKSEIQKAVEETANAGREQRKAEKDNESSKIVLAIEALSDAQKTQTAHEDRNDGKSHRLNLIMIFLVFGTVVFTGLSWWVFNGQLDEAKADRRPWVKFINLTTTVPLTFDESGVKAGFKVIVQNVGKAVAENVQPRVEFNIKPFRPKMNAIRPDTNEQIFIATSAMRLSILHQLKGTNCAPENVKIANTFGGYFIFPGDGIEDDVPSTYLAVARGDFRSDSSFGDVSAWLSVCISYADEHGAPHGTSFLMYYAADAERKYDYPPVGTVPGKFEINPNSIEAY
jgi:hypothetical protein